MPGASVEQSNSIEIEGAPKVRFGSTDFVAIGRGVRQKRCQGWLVGLVATIIIFVLAFCLFHNQGTPRLSTAWDNALQIIEKGDVAQYLAFMSPALLAIRYSYTATHGSNLKHKEVHATLGEDWKRFKSLDSNPKEGGFHGLVFWQADKRRLILAMRGTDLETSNVNSRADMCANMLLFENKTYDRLPHFCQLQFSEQDLDYLAQAETFADRALEYFKPAQTMMVGHSLGAGLAVLVAARLSREERWEPLVLALAAPDLNKLLQAKMHRELWQLQVHRYIIIDNSLDPVCWWEHSGTGGPTRCTFSTVPEPSECLKCKENNDSSHWHHNPHCLACFHLVHTLGAYLHNLKGTVEKPPKHRPRCEVPSTPMLT